MRNLKSMPNPKLITAFRAASAATLLLHCAVATAAETLEPLHLPDRIGSLDDAFPKPTPPHLKATEEATRAVTACLYARLSGHAADDMPEAAVLDEAWEACAATIEAEVSKLGSVMLPLLTEAERVQLPQTLDQIFSRQEGSVLLATLQEALRALRKSFAEAGAPKADRN